MKCTVKTEDSIVVGKADTLKEAHNLIIKEVIQQLLNLPFNEKEVLKIWDKINKERSSKEHIPQQVFLDESGVDLRFEIYRKD